MALFKKHKKTKTDAELLREIVMTEEDHNNYVEEALKEIKAAEEPNVWQKFKDFFKDLKPIKIPKKKTPEEIQESIRKIVMLQRLNSPD